jgi:hypothetical protein
MRLLTMFEAQFPTPGPSQAGKTRGLAAFSERHLSPTLVSESCFYQIFSAQ